jgi:hypothetical protein
MRCALFRALMIYVAEDAPRRRVETFEREEMRSEHISSLLLSDSAKTENPRTHPRSFASAVFCGVRKKVDWPENA